MTQTESIPTTFDPGGTADPYTTYSRMRDADPVHHVRLPDGADLWLVTRYAEARRALADPRLSKNPANAAPQWQAVAVQPSDGEDTSLVRHMLNADPPDHSRLRRLVLKAFTAGRVDALRPRIQAITDGLLDDVAGAARDGGPVDLVDTFAFPLPITVICELLGVPLDEQASLHRWSQALSTLVADAEALAAVGRAAAELSEYLSVLIARKEREPGEDLLSALIAARDEGQRLDHGELTAMGFLLIVGGHETTVHLISNTVYALLRHPEHLTAVRADPSLVPKVVEESLRWEGSIAAATWRFALETIEDYGGTPIPAGAPVLVSLAAADRDPTQFADPDRFDPYRKTQGHLAFGHGIHYCMGAPLARMQAQVAVTSVLARYPDLRLAVPVDELRWRDGMLIRGVHALPVHVR
ncbi:cytochrome P450 [Dactylosporangium cerinum]|uniref:Cytochrome P450 n=1 Tax=Dactylosporangium cerinum TaxID=1434730 RepID=A0ABV9VSY1_9ACTN